MIKVATMDDNGIAKPIRTDNNGSIKTTLPSTSISDERTLSAGADPQYHSVNGMFLAKSKHFAVRNTSSRSPVEFLINQELTPVNIGKRMVINPGEIRYLGFGKPTHIGMRAKHGIATIKFMTSDEPISDVLLDGRQEVYADTIRGWEVLSAKNHRLILKDPTGLKLYRGNIIEEFGVSRFDDNLPANPGTVLKEFDSEIISAVITNIGSLLVFEKSGVLWRLNNYETDTGVWEVVLNSEIAGRPIQPWRFSRGVDQYASGSSSTGVIVFGEYSRITDSAVGLWRSTDDGVTWIEVLSYINGVEIRHFHSIKADLYENGTWYATSGDSPSQSKFFKSVDHGVTWEMIAQGSKYKTTEIVVTGEYLYWGTDGEGAGNSIYRVPKNDVLALEELYSTQNTFLCMRKSGNRIYAGIYVNGANNTDRNVAEVVYSDDEGRTWQTAVKFPTNGAAGFSRFAKGMDRWGNMYATLYGNIVGINKNSYNTIVLNDDEVWYTTWQ